MSKHVGTLLALAITLLLVTGRDASAQATQTQTVDANIGSALSLTVSTLFSPNPWILTIPGNPNANSSLVLRARGNVGYAIRDNCDSPASKAGFENNLFQWDATNSIYVGGGYSINNNLQIRATGVSAAVDILPTATGDTLVNGGAQTPTPAAGRLHTIELSNTVDFGDRSLTAAEGFYHMVITYTIIAGAA